MSAFALAAISAVCLCGGVAFAQETQPTTPDPVETPVEKPVETPVVAPPVEAAPVEATPVETAPTTETTPTPAPVTPAQPETSTTDPESMPETTTPEAPLVPTATPIPAAPAKGGVATGKGAMLTIYGSVRGDWNIDDSTLNDTQVPSFVRSEDAANTTGSGSFHGVDVGASSAYTRLTRIGFKFAETEVEKMGARVAGIVETDFYAFPASESRHMLRMRLAYMDIMWATKHGKHEPFKIRLGQDADLISPLYPDANHDMIFWNAGNIGDRRMQLKFLFVAPLNEDWSARVTPQLGLEQTGAVTQGDLDSDGVLDGEFSTRPGYQLRLGFEFDGGEKGDKVSQFGFWAADSRQETFTAIGGQNVFRGHIMGIDVKVWFGDKAWIAGEWYEGVNTSDWRGGIGQGYNTTLGAPVNSTGNWFELGIKATTVWTIIIGATNDDPDDKDLNANSPSENATFYLVNKLSDGAFTFAVEIIGWETSYVGFGKGDNDRIKFWVNYAF
jgi:hypothetical protein